MEIKHETHSGKGRFYILVDGKEVGEMTYRKDDNGNLKIDHTYVDESQREKGLGRKMVGAAVEYARKNDKIIVPICPFVQDVLSKNVAYADVLK